jgi:hypothetical protein
MNSINDFITHIEHENQPVNDWTDLIQSLWWAKKGNWEKAHNLAQDVETEDGFWVHAYLHRVEGDLGNAGYWYRRAKKKPKTDENLELEWMELAEYFLSPG